MNTTATQPLTTLELETLARPSTNMPFFSMLEPLQTSTIPTFTELLAEYTATIDKPEVAWSFLCNDEPASPFSIYQRNLAYATPQPVRWLWPKRLPLPGITLLDGDHGCGKSLLALHIAAHVSSGAPMPDGTKTLQGGVVIVSPNADATTTQLQLLTALGADLSRIEILSFIQEPAPPSHNSSHHPFSLPEDLLPLLQAIDRIDARLVIFDPFISLLSRKFRCTDQRLCHLLTDLNLHLIERNVACLLIRNCGARGRHARPSLLERSDHFATIAVSRLLLAPDPMQPNRLLLSHATSRHAALTPTLALQIHPKPDNHEVPYVTVMGNHSLQAKEFINHRPDTLHLQILAQHLLQLITAATDPLPVATLYALSPHSSVFQIQRALSDLLHMGQIQRPTRGFYAPAPPTTMPSFNSSAAINQIAQPANDLKTTPAITENIQPANDLNISAAITENIQLTKDLNMSAAKSKNIQAAKDLNTTATRIQIAQYTTDIKITGAITESTQLVKDLNMFAAITESTQPVKDLKTTGAITLKPKASKRPHKGHNKHRNTKKRH